MRRGLWIACALAALSAGAPADAQSAADPVSLARGIAAPWPALQRENGSFPDYMESLRGLDARDRYGNAALGNALLRTGVRDGNQELIGSGLRALIQAARTPDPHHSIVFENAELAAGYNLARESVPGHPVFRSGRDDFEERLRSINPVWIGRGRTAYFNQFLVDAVAILELERSGLRSSQPGTVLNDPQGNRRLVEELVNRDLLTFTREQTARTQRAGLTTLATDGPLAYHVLTLAYTARTLRMLGPSASPAARALVQRYARATWAFIGPDGDVAYFGRSQQQSWTLAMTAYGMEEAAQDAGARWAPRFRAVAQSALDRLQTMHTGGPFGVYLTPGFRRDFNRSVGGMDDYVSGPAYTGLTLTGLEWLNAARRPGRLGRLAADGPLAYRLGAGAGSFAVVSTGTVWYVVRRRPGSLADLRSGGGLVALKVRDSRGRWRDVLPQRPLRLPLTREDTSGPILRRGSGLTAFPYGSDVRIRRGSRVDWAVDFRQPGYGALVRRSGVRFEPVRCGVRMRVPARRGDRHQISAFLPADPQPQRVRGRGVIAGGNLRVSHGGPGRIVLGGPYTGSIDPALVRTRLSSRAGRTRAASFTYALRGPCARR